ncbi:MAG: Jag N-terminal domain-containing protein [Anaerolineae bacterium]|nr:Jag N-terminal domain-containing protein [Anaerolineae bacterium]
MSREIEVRGQTVDIAIEVGLAKLGLNRSDVIVDVIDEGSRGILGLGAREAIVRLLPMTPVMPEQKPAPAPVKPAPPKPAPPKPAPPKPAPTPAKIVAPPPPKTAETTDQEDTAVPPLTSEELEQERDTAVAVLQTILGHMQIEADIHTAVTEPDDVTGQPINLIEITGPDLGVLIGPRGDTLVSLQYMARLIVSHQLKNKANFVIDVEGYRERRKQALARLAERMASKVIKQQRPVSLEPMPANERRVIHMTLRDHAAVYTQSTGEGSQRRVRIHPKR